MTTSPYNSTAPNPPEAEASIVAILLKLLLAWVVPGLGHIIIGERVRGAIFAITIHSLFAIGLLVGGIRSINPEDQPIWTYTQFLTGWPMFIANSLEKRSRDLLLSPPGAPAELPKLYRDSDYAANRPDPNNPADTAMREQYAKDYILKTPLFAYHPKINDIGAVYCGIAGMLNLLVLFDVLLRITGSVREDPEILRKSRMRARQASSSPAPPHPSASPAAAPSVAATGAAP